MEPIKGFMPIARWLLRLSLGIIVYKYFFDTFLTFSFNNLNYFMALLFIIFTVLLIVGGLLKKNATTVISGMVIFILSIALIFMGQVNLDKVLTYFLPATIGFYFMAAGNKG
jgi:quinol-cytochrome oxidoreductase complex cytochrome b subunit